MPYSEALAERVRTQVQETPGYAEKKMFGGLTFMIRGHMCIGVVGDELMVRVGKDLNDEALTRPHARPMDFTGKPMDGFVYVGADGLATDSDLTDWVDLELQFNSTMPEK